MVLPVLTAVLAAGSPVFAVEPAPATPQPSGSVAVPAAPEEFTPYSRVSDGENGRRVAEVFQVPAFTRFGDGRWRQVDNRIEPGSNPKDEQAAFSVPGGYRPMDYGRTPARLASIQLDRGQVRLSAQDLASSVGEQTPDGVVYRDVAPATDLTVRPSGAGLRSVFRLNSPSAPTSFRFHLSDPTGQLGTPTRTPDGGYVFGNEVDPDVRFGFRPAYAYEVDLAHPEYAVGHDLNSAQLTLTRAGDGYDIVKTISPEWLKGKQFPIELDPLAYFGRFDGTPTRDCHLVNTPLETRNFCPTDTFEVGYGSGTDTPGSTRRLMNQYSLGTVIPRDALVTRGDVYLYMRNNYHNQKMNVRAWETGDSWTHQATWNHRDGSTPWTNRAGNPVPGWPSSGWLSSRLLAGETACPGQGSYCSWELTPLVKRWVDGSAPQNGVTMTSGDENYWSSNKINAVFAFSSQEATGNWPYLRVEYTPKPTAPQNVGATAGDSSARVKWEPPANASAAQVSSYTIRSYSSDGGAIPAASTCTAGATDCPSTNGFLIGGLTNGKSYTFGVTATGPAGEGPEARTATAVVPQAPDTTGPTAPAVESSSHPLDSSGNPPWWARDDIALKWAASDPSGVAGYSFLLDQASLTAPSTDVVPSLLTSTTYSDQASGAYWFHVRAKDTVGNWGSPSHYPIRVDVTVPTLPGAVRSTSHTAGGPAVEDRTVALAWDAASDAHSGVAGYSWVFNQSATEPADATTDTAELSATSPKLADGQWYAHVRTIDRVGNAGGDVAIGPFSIAGVGAPPAPTAKAGDASATVSWQAPQPNSSVTGYEVISSPGAVTVKTAADARSTTVPGLTNGVTYTFTVRALTPDGPEAQSPPSNAVTPQVVVQEPPNTPTAPVPADGAVLRSLDALSVLYSDPNEDAGTVTFTVTSTDSGKTLFTLTSPTTASGQVATVRGSRLSALVDGGYRWSAVATDSTGRTSTTATFGFTLRTLDGYLGYDGRSGWSGPVNTGLGALVHAQTDVVLNTAGPELSAARAYNSLTTRDSGLGAGWTHTFGIRWTGDPAGNIAIDWADGRREVHTAKADGSYIPPTGFYTSLTADGAGGFRLTTKDRAVYAFNSTGALTGVTDASGRTLRLSYVNGQLDKVTDPASGRYLDYDWTGSRITRVATPPVSAHGGALVWSYSYTGDRLTGVCTPRSTTAAPVCWRYGYDDTRGLLTAVLTPRGNAELTAGYAGDGRVAHTATGTGDRTTFTYPTASTTRITDPRGHVTVHEHDASFRLVADTGPTGSIVRSQYDAADNRIKVTDGLGQVATVDYDLRGNPIKVTNPAGESTYSTFADDLLVATRDGRSASAIDDTFRTDLGYDARRNRTAEISPATADHGRITRTWTISNGTEPAIGGGTVPPGLELTATDGAGRVTTFGYDLAGDLRQRIEPSGLTTRYDYDELGRKTTQTVIDTDADADAREAVTRWAYDGHGNTVTTTSPAVRNDITAVTHQARVLAVYDGNDNLIETHDQDLTGADATRTTRHEYDDADREIRTLDALGHETRRTFDPAGNVATVTDPEGRTYRIDYEPRNLPTALTLLGFVQDPLAGSTPRGLPVARMTYDAAGRQQTVTDALGRTTRTSYDAADRPKQHVLEGYRDLDGTRRNVVLSAVDYDKAGHPIRSTVGGPRNPLTVSTDYDAAGWITREITDPTTLARTAAYTRDRVGNETIRTLTAAGSSRTEQVRSRYDSAHRLIEQTVENGELDLTARTGYDQRGNATSQTGPRGTAPGATAADHTTSTSFDVLGRGRRVTAPPVVGDDGRTDDPPTTLTRPVTVLGFDTWGNATHTRDPRGHVTTTSYDALNRRSRVQHPAYTAGAETLAPVEAFGYDRVGNLIRQTSRRGHTTEWIFDALNRAVAQTDPAAETGTARGVTRTSYDDVGNPVSSTDPTGATTETGFDDRDRPRTLTRVVRDPDGSGPATGGRFTSQTDYDDQGHVLLTRGATLYSDRSDDPATAVDERYAVTQMQRNAAGELLRLTDPTGAVSTSSYDLAGRLLDQSDPVGRRTSTSYDLAGRPVAVRRHAPDGTLLTTTTSTPDAAGNPVATVSPRGHEPGADPNRFRTTRAFDALNRLLSVTVPVNSDSAQDLTTRYGYDLAGNHSRTINGRGHTTRTTYQPWNLPEQNIEPPTTAHPDLPERTWTFRYDDGGLPVAENQPGAVSVQRSFDALGRLTGEAGEGTGAARATRRFGYDLAGRRTTASHPEGTISLGYDDRSLLVGSSGPAGTAAFGFDADGRMTERRDAAGTSRFGYTARGELRTAQDSLSSLTRTWTFTAAGQLATASSSAGASRRYSYDGLARLVDDQHHAADSSLRAEQRYSYDADGNLTSQTIAFPDPAADLNDPAGSTAALTAATNPAEGRHAYCYDHAGRIVRWDRPLSTDSTTPDDSDDCGAPNTLTDSADLTDYTWDRAGNRTSAGGQRYSYDERNRLLTGPGGSYTWTARGTLSSSTDGGQAREYTFDGLGRQTQAGGVALSYDALDRIAVRTPATDPGSPTPVGAQFAYAGLEIDPVDDQTNDPVGADLGARYARSPVGRLLALSQNGGSPRQALLNRHGDLTALTDSSGTLTDSKIYDPFGQTTADSISGLTLPTVGFQGDWTDPTTNQVWMGARWYDPANASFTRRDTVHGELGTPVSLNRYTYGQNNPLYYLDPDGRRVVATGDERTETAMDRAVSRAVSQGRRSAKALAEAHNGAYDAQLERDPQVFLKQELRKILPGYALLESEARDELTYYGEITSATTELLKIMIDTYQREQNVVLDHNAPVEYLRQQISNQLGGDTGNFERISNMGDRQAWSRELAIAEAERLQASGKKLTPKQQLEVASYAPGGTGADIALTGMALKEGNYGEAVISGIGVVPLLGDGAKAGIRLAGDLLRGVTKYVPATAGIRAGRAHRLRVAEPPKPAVADAAEAASPSTQAAAFQGKGAYPGVDAWENVTLKAGTTVHAGEPGLTGFATSDRVASLVGHDAAALNQGLQIAARNGTYRPGMTAFELTVDVRVARSTALANPQFGAGGLDQYFIPNFGEVARPVVTRLMFGRPS